MTRRPQDAFTLLEVMVAVAILALSFTAIFSSEVGAIRIAHRARTISTATTLARCKMAEIEELVANEGLPAIEKAETDACCEGAEMKGFECDWRIDRIVLPAPADDTGAAQDLGEPGGGPANQSPTMQALNSGDPVSALAAGGSLASGGFGPLILSYAFPILKPSFEEQVRRATVKIRWKEGTHDESFDVVQYLVDDRGAPGATDEEAPEEGNANANANTNGAGANDNGENAAGDTTQ